MDTVTQRVPAAGQRAGARPPAAARRALLVPKAVLRATQPLVRGIWVRWPAREFAARTRKGDWLTRCCCETVNATQAAAGGAEVEVSKPFRVLAAVAAAGVLALATGSATASDLAVGPLARGGLASAGVTVPARIGSGQGSQGFATSHPPPPCACAPLPPRQTPSKSLLERYQSANDAPRERLGAQWG